MVNKSRFLAIGLLAALSVPACAAQDSTLPEETESAASAATATRIYASEGDLDFSFETLGTFEERDGVRALIFRGTANRYLQNVFSFVPDDAFAQANIISERRLEVVIHEGHELNTLLSGLPLFVSINTFTGSPNQYTARVEISARFYDFLGASDLWIDEAVKPSYVVNGTDNIVYRGGVNVLGNPLTVTAPDGAPTVFPVDADSYRLDWSYANLHDAIDPHTQAFSFSATRPDGTIANKTARLVARVTGLALTSGDPYNVWPTPPCEPAVYSCYHSQPAGTTDFAACGTYRQVQRCVYANACDVAQEPLSLSAIDASSLEPARAAWNQGSTGYNWRNIQPIAAYDTPECPEAPVTITSIVDEIASTDQNQPAAEYGTFTDRAGLASTTFFGSSGGSALLAAIDAFAGGGDIEAWSYSEQVSCHNCTDNIARVVLYYPQSGVVLVLDGNYGYDS
ncbi:hypothetical protein [Polyangium jinanense]|uniref:Uncharacterized protein n=1 Tax=Polyangium jinanense TaxID=2829994 RepID=A0A9X4AXZ4_9BACT|nr:hypothetical protein [Polyangium jinanense]MDC3961765.1 hypothetical protein [Polyangium jinanense]MDC3988341.1 hypothetical protein [Polyangium jinanense]